MMWLELKLKFKRKVKEIKGLIYKENTPICPLIKKSCLKKRCCFWVEETYPNPYRQYERNCCVFLAQYREIHNVSSNAKK